MKKYLIFMLALLLLVGCSTKKERDRLEVVTSFYPLFDFTKKISGEGVDVYNILPNGQDAHSFEPTPKDMARLEEADVFIYHGAGLESWVDAVLKSLEGKNVKVVAVSDYVELLAREEHDHEHEEGHDHDHDHGAFDPHTWLSPLNADKIMAGIRDTLISLDESNKTVYQTNYEKQHGLIQTLHKDFEAIASSVQTRTFLVDHQAYAYLAHEYNLEQKGIMEGLLSEEPTPKELENILTHISENGVNSIFANPMQSPKVVEVIQKEANVKVLPLYTLETITNSQEGEDYFSLMYKNLNSLKEGLGNASESH